MYMKKKVGIVGFSFGLRTEELEPNPSNIALTAEVIKAIRLVQITGHVDILLHDSKPVVVAQWEISKGLRQKNVEPDHVVELRTDGTYLDSAGVWDEAKRMFDELEVTDVIIVAQPFLHLPGIKMMIEKDNRRRVKQGKEPFRILEFVIGDIPFDDSPLNTQPWTRSKLALLIYAIKSTLPGFKHGHGGKQNGVN